MVLRNYVSTCNSTRRYIPEDQRRQVNICVIIISTLWAIASCGGIAPHIPNIGTRRWWVVSFTPRPLYPQGTAFSILWIGVWVGPECRSGRCGIQKKLCPSKESNPVRSQSVTWLSCPGPLITVYCWETTRLVSTWRQNPIHFTVRWQLWLTASVLYMRIL
jgi:hypothetical protein